MSTPQQTPSTPSRQLSKFLQPSRRERDRDRPRSSSGNTDGATTGSETAGKGSSSSQKILGKKTSKLFSRNRDTEDAGQLSPAPNGVSSSSAAGGGIHEPPVIIEPPSNSKPRARPPRPSNASDNASFSLPNASSPPSSHQLGALGSGGGSVGRNLGDLSSRLSGWFNQTFTGSSSDLPGLLAQANASPGHQASASLSTSVNAGNNSGYSSSTGGKKIAIPLMMAAKQGKDHLDKAMRYLLDSDAQPDKSTDKIWLLGVEHPGYEPPPPPSSAPASILPSSPPPSGGLTVKRLHRRDSTESRNKSPSSFRHPLPVSHSNSSTQSLSSAVSSSSTVNPSVSGRGAKNELSWPADFYSDYTSCIWVTYRNAFPAIRDTSLSSLEPPISCTSSNVCLPSAASNEMAPPPSPNKPRWPWSTEKVWTSDAGWGCMLRTGQSLLANSLVHLHLSRQWRRPNQPSLSPEYTNYVKILTWFLDTPSPLVPFGIHRMALAGKELGKEVGSWFGPSTAAGAIKRLVGEFDCGLEVVVGTDGVVYASEVYAASNVKREENGAVPNTSKAPKASGGKHGKKPLKWGDRPVLVLLGIRLGIDGVNPIYYNSVKALFTFPQSVGIAGGRPSSSYYFVGSQGDSLYYLDPHHTRPAVPLRNPPANLADMSFDESLLFGQEDSGSVVGSSAASQASSRLGRRRGSEVFMQGHISTPDTSESERKGSKRLSIRRASLNRMSSSHHQQQTPTSPSSTNSHGATIPLSSSPLARSSMSTPPQASFSPPRSRSSTAIASNSVVPPSPTPGSNGFPQSPTSPMSASSHASMTPMPAHAISPSSTKTTTMDLQTPLSPSSTTVPIDPMSAYLATAYSISELRSFHCERVRKMPISGLDPSMLLGFLCRDEADWKDFRERISDMAKTKKPIFSIQDEPPSWPDDENELLDLESASDDMEDEDEEVIESPIGGEEEEEEGDEEDDGIEVKRRQTIEAKNKDSVPEPIEKDVPPEPKDKDGNEDSSDENEAEEDDDEDAGFDAITPVAPSTKFIAGRHDTIIGRAKPEVAAAAAAVSKTTAAKPSSATSSSTPTPAPRPSTSSSVNHDRNDSRSTTTSQQSHDRKDSRGHEGDNDDALDDEDDLDDEEWVDPIAPRSPIALPTGSRHTKVISVSSSGSAQAYAETLDRAERHRAKGEDASPTPTHTPAPMPASASQYGSSMVSHHQKTRSMTRELPAIPTTVVSMSREPRPREGSAHSRDSSTRSSRRVSQIALGEVQVPFPTRTSEHRKTSSASSRSATSISAGSTPASPSSSPASQYPTHGNTHSSHSSQSYSSHTNSHSYSHHRQQHSGAERDATSYPFPGSTTDESGTTSSDSGPSSEAWAGDEKTGSMRGSLVPKRERKTTVGRTAPSPVPTPGLQQLKAKHSVRTTSGGVRAVWKDEDGDDF